MFVTFPKGIRFAVAVAVAAAGTSPIRLAVAIAAARGSASLAPLNDSRKCYPCIAVATAEVTSLPRPTPIRILIAIATAVLLFAAPVHSQTPTRPRITAISHVGYFVSDLPAAINFWHALLGFDEAYDLKKPGSTADTRIAFIKINDHQHVELFNEPPTAPPNFLSHICFTVDDIQQMRLYLNSKGYDVKPVTGKTRTGDYAFEIKDPDGMLVEFVQSLPTCLEAQATGKFAPASRISTHIYHLGFLVGNSQRSLDFYGNILGFKETWRGGANPAELSWINMRVPDGTDYVEFMLYRKLPTTFGDKNHIALEVPDVIRRHHRPRRPARLRGLRQTTSPPHRRQRQTSAEPLRSRRYPRRTHGTLHRRRQARPSIHRSAAASSPPVESRSRYLSHGAGFSTNLPPRMLSSPKTTYLADSVANKVGHRVYSDMRIPELN